MKKNWFSCRWLFLRHTPEPERVTYYSGSHSVCRECGRAFAKRTSLPPIL